MVAALAVLVFMSAGAEELPRDPEPGSFEVEPPLLPGNLVPDQTSSSQSPADITQLERKLGRARDATAAADRLVRIGVLAKLEAENRAMRVVRLEAELAQARLASAESELDRKEQSRRTGEATEAEVNTAQSQVKEAKKTAEVAVAKQRKAELDAAALNVARRQKLLALGSGGKSALRRAEEKLAELKRSSQ